MVSRKPSGGESRQGDREKSDAYFSKLAGSQNPHLIAWGDEQVRRKVPVVVVAFALEAARGVSTSFELLRALTSGRLSKFGEAVGSAEWTGFYKRPDRHFQKVGNMLGNFLSQSGDLECWGGTEARAIGIGVKSWKRLSREERLSVIRKCLSAILEENPNVTWPSILQEARRRELESWKLLREELATEKDDLNYADLPGATPEMQFFMRVTWPCQMIYGEGSHQLFRQAVTGNIDAIDKLIRIDKRILGMPEIMRHVVQFADCGNEDALRILASAMSNLATSAVTTSQLKLRILGMIWQLMQQLRSVPHCKIETLQMRDLRSLLDAISRDQGNCCEEELPDDDAAFKKAVGRDAKKTPLKGWDIFHPRFVP